MNGQVTIETDDKFPILNYPSIKKNPLKIQSSYFWRPFDHRARSGNESRYPQVVTLQQPYLMKPCEYINCLCTFHLHIPYMYIIYILELTKPLPGVLPLK